MGNFFRCPRPKFKLIRDFMPILITCKFDEDQIKTAGVSLKTSFSPFKGGFLLPWQAVLIESAPKPKSSLSPIPPMIHVKLDQDWLTDLGDSIISLLKPESTLKGT